MFASSSKPTVFHITHHKAGYQWVKEVLRQSARWRMVKPQTLSRHLTQRPIVQGKIYPTVCMPRDEFKALLAKQEHRISYSSFFVIRDLRDTLVSLYFNLL